MENIISKEELERLTKIKGGVRGDSIQEDLDFIRRERGEEGLERLEKILKELGSPIDYKNIKSIDFYSLGWQAVMMLVTKKLFGFRDKDFQEWGKFGEKSLLIRLFMRYFISIEMVAKQAPRMWRHNLTIGDLKVIKVDKEKKNLILRLEDFTILPCYCLALGGYFTSIVQMVVGSEANCQEIKCAYQGGNYHEFLITWK